jgi:DNA-binding NarL/FixJ family response regulator
MIRIVIVGEQPEVRKGLSMRLAAETDFSVAGEAPDCLTAVGLINNLCPEVVLVDVDMLGKDGISAAKELHAHCPHTRMVIISLHDDAFTCERVKSSGAAAFIAKSKPAESLPVTIRNLVV